ncbi:MAG TPA: HlyD family efflux transporter periplasmic adaptor subunit [Candidatus Sulfotelmatobacter sp.]|nr:HlyD family efflux transporter periplasmic adaptor subunit [Candidatus Sulfotelmatobacter sp.]
MNLAEALNVALPETPARTVALDRLPRVDPNLIVQEQMQDGKRTIMVVIPASRRIYPLSPEQWDVLSLFDGTRTYEEIAQIETARTSVLYTEDAVREFAEGMADEPFWYRTPQEQNIALWSKLRDERLRRTQKKSRWGNLAEITFSAWDPNVFLTKLHEKLEFVFGRPFLIFTLILFAFTAWVWIDRWGEIWRDSIEYYTFTDKGVADLAEFWVLILFVGLIHECAHGLACKHTGGEVHRMGFLLMYLSPCFFCDVTEAWAFGSKWQRIMTSSAGLWSELILCGFATITWWGLPPGGFIHELSYKIILIGGVAAVLINLNPLVKLDGYFIFSEMLEISELKDLSTQFTNSWVKKHVFRLPVEVPYMTLKRRILFSVYSVLSSAYGYLLLIVVVVFVYNAFYKYTPQWAFVPALGLAWVMFRSRIRSFLRFLRGLYLDKKELLMAELKSRRAWVLGGLLLCLLLAPIWREGISGRFVLEPLRKSVIRAHVPGRVVDVQASEGQLVRAAQPLVTLRDLKLESELAQVQAEYQGAVYRVTSAQLRNAPSAAVEHERDQLAIRLGLLRDQSAQLVLASDIPGSVVTPRLGDRLGTSIAAGTVVAEVADMSAMRARIYVAESDLRKLHLGSSARLRIGGLLPSVEGTVTDIAPDVSAMQAGVMEKGKYIGLHTPHYYFADICIPNPDGILKIGLTGEAKIVVRRRSVAGLIGEAVADFVSRKLW